MKNKNAGFTLVELIVTMTVLLMLASFGIAGVLAYQDYADYKRQNNYAQTLFVAAQTELTACSVRGEEAVFLESPGEILPLSSIITAEGKKADDSGKGQGSKQSTIYYLTGTKETYRKYLAGEYEGKTDIKSREYRLLYGIFEDYLYDKSILEAAIALEYNPQDGLVYSVLYSDKRASFTYNQTNKEGRVNICDRQQDYRSEYMIGYYGMD